MKLLSFFLCLAITISASAGGVSRSRARIVHHNVDQVIIAEKIIQFDEFANLQVIAVPITSTGVQYYYQSEPLRGRGQGLSDEDRKLIVEEIVKGVLAGIEVVGDDGKPVEKPNTGGGGTIEPPKVDPPTVGSDLDKQVLGIFTANCSSCHTAGALHAESIPVLLAEDGSLAKLTDKPLEQLRRFKIHDAVFYNRMPKNSSPLSEGDVDVLHRWIKEAK